MVIINQSATFPVALINSIEVCIELGSIPLFISISILLVMIAGCYYYCHARTAYWVEDIPILHKSLHTPCIEVYMVWIGNSIG